MANPWVRINPDPETKVTTFNDLRRINSQLIDAVNRQLEDERVRDNKTAISVTGQPLLQTSEDTEDRRSLILYDRGREDGFNQAVERMRSLLDADCENLMRAAGWSRLKEPLDGDPRGRLIRHLRLIGSRIQKWTKDKGV
jgi:hypothetical protein